MSMNRQQRKAAEKKAKKANKNQNAQKVKSSSIKVTSSARAKDVPEIKISREELEQLNKTVVRARMHTDEKDYLKASEMLMEVIKRKPDHLDALGQMTIVAERMRNFQGALDLFKAIKKVYPGLVELDLCIAHVHMQMGDLDTFFSITNKNKKIFEKKPDYHEYTGLAYLYKGDKKLALTHLRKACEMSPDNIDFIYNYFVQAGRKVDWDDELEQDLVNRLKKISVNHKELYWRSYANYTLYNIYEQFGDTDTAFNYLKEGSRNKMKMIGYPRELAINRLKAVKQYFSKDFFDEFDKKDERGPLDNTPIFIIGMPRSGTTLLEQILHSHPKISGIGEDLTFEKLCMSNIVLPNRGNVPYPLSRRPDQQNKLSFYEVGQKYLEHIKKLEPHAEHIVNKSIGTLLFTGLLPYCLPKCKIIHIRRNAMDSCLSMFTKSFSGEGHRYSYDLECLGEYYDHSMDIVDHWLEELPHPITRIDYETLVENTEEEARRIIDFLELEWDDNCLSFHKTEKSVRTASVNQVRKPVYNTSIERWRKYEQHLIPLIKGLGKSAPESAKEYLRSVEDN